MPRTASNATIERATILVEAVGKWGVKCSGQWYSLSKFARPPLTPEDFVEGETYDVEITIKEDGKIYVNKILAVQAPSAKPKEEAAAPAVREAAAPASAPALRSAGGYNDTRNTHIGRQKAVGVIFETSVMEALLSEGDPAKAVTEGLKLAAQVEAFINA